MCTVPAFEEFKIQYEIGNWVAASLVFDGENRTDYDCDVGKGPTQVGGQLKDSSLKV